MMLILYLQFLNCKGVMVCCLYMGYNG